MEHSTSQTVLTIEKGSTDYTVSSLLGLSIGVVTTIFTIFIIGLQFAGIHFHELLMGDFHFHGDPSVLYMGIFLICATILLVVQYHFAIEEEEN